MRLEPNLSMLFADLPLTQRPAAAAAAGSEAAELWWPFDQPVPAHARIDELVAAFEDAGVTLACLNVYGGDLGSGERGILSVPGREQEFRDNVDVAVDVARRLGCRTLNALYGNRVAGVSAEQQEALAIERLAVLGAATAAIGATIVIEALNPVDVPGYGLHHVDQVVAFLDRARAATGVDARLSFDVYHVVMAGDDPVSLVEAHASRIGHVQVADVPGRHEPGSGSIDFEAVLGSLARSGYDGWVGLEYNPTVESGASIRMSRERLASGVASSGS
jgi:hydroxypyruvate isomerase